MTILPTLAEAASGACLMATAGGGITAWNFASRWRDARREGDTILAYHYFVWSIPGLCLFLYFAYWQGYYVIRAATDPRALAVWFSQRPEGMAFFAERAPIATALLAVYGLASGFKLRAPLERVAGRHWWRVILAGMVGVFAVGAYAPRVF